ncbi:hypothetical protein [Clostridium prolinivorans]|jgi:hypothetical protein|uniref:hypothetical protein n=1 Tax=Clostridium prolinivorans TaxID=2769420 RepID=UPI000FDBA121|nr:hypothetical protein [Clostridium prolinivorans]
MDSGVSWRRAMLIAKLKYPNAQMSTLIYFAKQIYIAECSSINKNQVKVKKKFRKPKERYLLQGASI